MSGGVVIGLSNLMYAILTSDPAPGAGQATYQTPVLIPGVIKAMFDPKASTDTLFADNGPYETATALGKMDLQLDVADLPLAMQAALLGHTLSGGVLVRKAADVPPWVAIGYKSLKSNGSYRYTWLAKGKFAPPKQDGESAGDKVKFQNPTITGAFVARSCDGEWERHIDQDDSNYTAAMGTNWFNNPYGGALVNTPLVVNSVAPADAATGVADAGTNVVWTFSAPLALTTVNLNNFMVLNDTTGAVVAGSLSIDSTHQIVTFAPSASFAATTVYRTLVTTSVTDQYGNTMASQKSTKFTTV